MCNYIVLFFIGFLFCVQTPAQVVFTVNSNDDTPAWDNPNTPENEADDGVCSDQFGRCSFRAALMETENGSSFARLINLNNTGTISLNPQYQSLQITSDYSINGNGRAVSGLQFSGPVLYMAGENITIRNLRVANTGENGGALLMAGNQLTVDSLIIDSTNVNAFGISVTMCSTATIKNSRILKCGTSGILVTMAEDLRIEDNVVSGCSVYGMQFSGYLLSNISIKRNLIGTNNSGTGANGNKAAGISVSTQFTSPVNMIIGGNSRADKNVISGNNYGIQLMTDNITVKNNFIGTNRYGTAAVPNTNNGIVINGKSNTIADNVISGNLLYGIMTHHEIFNAPSGNKIYGNIIGGKATDTLPLPNAIGICITGNSSDNIIGSGLSGSYTPNAIVHNTVHGISVNTSYPGGTPSKNQFRKNSFHDNGAYAVRLQAGTQNTIERPVLDSLGTGPVGITLLYGHGARPGATIDMYKSAPDSFNSGEGREWIVESTADAAGNFSLPISITECDKYTVMQTDPQGNSSEFSNNISPVPGSAGLSLNCQGPFIAGIPYNNDITLRMNWRNVPPAARRVVFALNGAYERDAVLTADEAKTTYDMGLLQAGNNQITWKIFGCDTTPIAEGPYTICAVSLPSWLPQPAAYCNSGSVAYEKVLTFPDNVVQALLNIPPQVDFISGTMEWLGAPKYTVTLRVPGNAFNVRFNSSFSLLGTTLSVRARANIGTQLSCSGLYPAGNARITASASHTFYAGYNLEDLLPACSGILSWPILSDGCEALHDVARRFRAGATVRGDISVGADIVANNSLTLSNATGSVTFSVKPFLDVLWIHVRGTGKIKFGVKLPEFDLINFNGSLSGKIYCDFPLPLFQFEKRLGPWYFSPDIAELIQAPQSNDPVRNSPSVPAAGADSCGPAQSGLRIADTLSVQGVPNDTRISVAPGTNGMFAAAWSETSSAFPRPAGDIAVRIYDGAQWKPVAKLNDDINADANPQLAFTPDNKLLVAWERNSSPSAPQGTDFFNPAYLKQFEIAYAVLNPSNGAVLSSGSLGSASRYDLAPRFMTAKDGTVTLVWQSLSGNTLFGKTGDPLALYAAKWNGASWNGTETVADNLTGIFSWDCAADSANKAMIAMTRDTDGQFGNSEDKEIYTIPYQNGAWQQPVRITSDNRPDWGAHCAYTSEGRPVLTWLKDSTILGVIGNLSNPPARWIDSLPHGIEYMNARVSCVKDTLLILFPEGSLVYYAYMDINSGTWSKAEPLNPSEDIQTALTAYSGGTGKPVFAYLQFPFADSLPVLHHYGQIRIHELNSAILPTAITRENEVVPGTFRLYEPFPNPFNGSTRLRIDIPTGRFVSIYLYDILGRTIKAVREEYAEAGKYEFILDASGLPSGVYYISVFAGRYAESKKLILLR